jgi:hypothetical protein
VGVHPGESEVVKRRCAHGGSYLIRSGSRVNRAAAYRIEQFL